MNSVAVVRFVLQEMVHFVMPFILCLCAILLLEKVAPGLGIVDKPSGRKKHSGSVPLVGGLAIFVAFSASIAMLLPASVLLFLLIFGLILVALGYFDDRYELSAITRIVVQAAVAMLMVLIVDLRIVHVGDLFGSGNVVLSYGVSLVFTVLCTIGVINSINMIDGVDGLAGTLLAMSLLAMAFIAFQSDFLVELKALVILGGAIAGFLCFNARLFVSEAKVFLGDTGSMFLGFCFCWFLISLSQGSQAPLSAVAAGWLFGLPLVDTVSVIVSRLVAGKSPMNPGRDHLHHQFIDAGFSVNETVVNMALIHGVFVVIGVFVSAHTALEPFSFWLFVVVTVLHFFCTPKLIARYAKLQGRGYEMS